jgi:hypothetical protein
MIARHKWWLVAIVLIALFAAVPIHAQTCTPVTVGKTYTIHDDGNGPNFSLGVNGGQYASGANVVLGRTGQASITVQLGPFSTNGYVNVFGLYGGCLNGWAWEGQTHQALYDGSTLIWSDLTNTTAAMNCGKVPSCYFNITDSRTVYFTLYAGRHHYILYTYMDAFIPGIGSSVQYTGYVTIGVR